MDPRTVGVEEELLLIDPATREATPRAPEVLKYAAEHEAGETVVLDHELFRHQLETNTPPVTGLADLRRAILAGRRRCAEAADGAGLLTAAAGAAPLGAEKPRATRDDRYLDMLGTYGEIALLGGTCGMHVHVEVASDEEGVAVIDAIAPWLPVVLAVSTNSPFHHGRDTRYASWRAQLWDGWPSAGPTEPFGSAEAYHEAGRRLIASGAARDEGMLYFDARLARDYPTVEVRVADVCTDPDDAVLVAALVRGLVTRAARTADEADPPRPWSVVMLRAARWRAARWGLGDGLLDPVTGELTSARVVLKNLLDHVREDLEDAGDLATVEDLVQRVHGATGSVRQRAAYERSGEVARVVDDLVERTHAAWRDPHG